MDEITNINKNLFITNLIFVKKLENMIDSIKHEFQLVEGEFSSEDALKLLMSLLNNKINFHQLESFSNQIRNGNDFSHSKKRVEYLKQSIEDIKLVLKDAEENGKQLKIDSVIKISLV